MIVGWSKMTIFASFSLYILRTFTFIEWSFCVKMCFTSASNGLALWLSEKTFRKFAELRINILSAVKM